MSDMSATSIHRAYNPNRRPAPMPMPMPLPQPMPQMPPMAPPYTVLPPVPVPQFPQPTLPPTGSYPSYPSQPAYPSYPSQPSYPQYPTQPQYPQYPSQPYPQYPGNGIGGFLGDVWSGVKERSHEIGQIVLHPFNQYARRPYMGRNPYQPRRSGETVGRWVVNGALIVGAFLGGRAIIGGVGGGAGAGMSGFLGRAAQVVAAPFQWAARGIGAVLGGAKDLIGGLLSGIFGGARVGFR